MKTSEFFGKLRSSYLWGNIAAMAVVLVLVCWGVQLALDIYTHHGEEVIIPNVKHKSFEDACHIMENAGLEVVVTDTGYVKALGPDCILEQSPAAGEKVKTGHIIYVTVNATHSPTISLPDVIDNSSLRDAMAKLTSMGFKLTQPEFVTGEKDWVYGIVADGKPRQTGDKISVDTPVTIQVGNGQVGSSDDIDFVDGGGDDVLFEDGGDVDEFQVVTGPMEENAE